MTSSPREIGTLIVVILKAKHLPNKRHIGKQDPYCVASMNGEKRRTKAIKRGGQHPEWDEEVRFTLLEDERPANNTALSGTPPPLPAKDDKPLNIKGGKIMRVSCFADDPREPDLIGEVNVDLTEVLTRGETDEWFTLTNKDKFSGEVYLELTFWSNEPVPVKKATPQVHKHYAGPGVFTPSDDSTSTPSPGDSSNSLPLRHASTSSVYDHSRYPSDSIARPSSSLAQLDLYVPPYEQRRVSTVDRLVNDFGEFGVSQPRRRESLPAPPTSYIPRPASSGGFSTLPSHPSQMYEQESYNSPRHYDERPRSSSNASALHHSASLSSTHSHYSAHAQPQPQYAYDDQSIEYAPPPSEYIPSEYQAPSRIPRYSVPTASSGFVAIQSSSTFAPVTAHTTGYPPSQSYDTAPTNYVPSHYTGFPSESLQSSTPSSFAQPPPSSSFHLQPQYTSTQPAYQYTVPPQQQQYTGAPPPPQSYHYQGPPSPPLSSSQSNTIGSRPLPPQPQMHSSVQMLQSSASGQQTPPGASYSPTHTHVPASSTDLYPSASQQIPLPSRKVSLPQPPSHFQPQYRSLAVPPPPPPPLNNDYQQYNVPPPPPLPNSTGQQQQPFYPGPPPRPPAQIISNQNQWQQQQQQQQQQQNHDYSREQRWN